MTKLVRLESDDSLSESQFTNNLAVALQLGKNAIVALKTLTMQFKEPPLIVNSKNNTINFSTSVNGPILNLRTASIPEGAYTVFELLGAFEKRMNSLLQSSETETTDEGFEWVVNQSGDVANGYNTNIAYLRTNAESINSANISTKINKKETMTFSTPNFYKNLTNAPNNGTYNAGMITKKFINRGAWDMTMQVVPQNGTQTENINTSNWVFYIGAEEVFSEATQAGIITKMLCGMNRHSNGNYGYKKNGVMVDSGIVIEAGDVIRICKKLISGTETQVLYSIKKGTNAATEFDGDIIQGTAIENIGIGGHYFSLKVGDDTGKIAFTNLNYYPTGVIAVNNDIYTVMRAEEIQNVLKIDNDGAVAASTITVFFPTEEVRLLLGFPVGFVSSGDLTHKFVSPDKIAFNIFNNDIVVEIPELPLNGYDHAAKQTRNIIMVISSGEVRSNVVARGSETYELSFTESATPLFVGINNKQTTFTAPQLSLRITSEGKILPMEGKISCLLLFRDENDN